MGLQGSDTKWFFVVWMLGFIKEQEKKKGGENTYGELKKMIQYKRMVFKSIPLYYTGHMYPVPLHVWYHKSIHYNIKV